MQKTYKSTTAIHRRCTFPQMNKLCSCFRVWSKTPFISTSHIPANGHNYTRILLSHVHFTLLNGPRHSQLSLFFECLDFKRHIWLDWADGALQTHVTALITNTNAAIWLSSCVLLEQIACSRPPPASRLSLCERELMFISFGMSSAAAPPPISHVFIG